MGRGEEVDEWLGKTSGWGGREGMYASRWVGTLCGNAMWEHYVGMLCENSYERGGRRKESGQWVDGDRSSAARETPLQGGTRSVGISSHSLRALLVSCSPEMQ